MNLLICGDSFSYDHKVLHSWPTRLSQNHQVTNLSQCGCSEYKIKLQLSNQNLESYDAILIFHTSPNRIYYNSRNTMHNDNFHYESDLLFSDVEHHRHHDNIAKIAYDYFVNIFDAEFYRYIHDLICRDIDCQTKAYKVFHFTAFDYSDLYQFDNRLKSLYNIWKDHMGNVNHLNPTGHDMFLDTIYRTMHS